MIRNRSVLQDWTFALPFMQQTVLLTAVRGPDGLPKYAGVKYLLRWYRRCILVSSLDDGTVLSNPFDERGGSFMGPSFVPDEGYSGDWRVEMDKIVSTYLKELDGIPHHFQLHLLHSIEIVGYNHPGNDIPAWWRGVYERLVHDMHLWPETKEQLDARLNDTRTGWLARADTATIA